MRVKVKLKKMKAPEAQFVSLVRRSANNIPFRIQKADDGESMIDLSSIKRVFKGAPAATPDGTVLDLLPETAGLVEVVRKAITDSGDHEDMKVRVQKAIQEYADRAMLLVEVVPPSDFKESVVERVKKAFPPKKTPAKTAPVEGSDEEEASESTDQEAAEKDPKAEDKAKAKPTEAPAEDPTSPSAQQKALEEVKPAAEAAAAETQSNSTGGTPMNKQMDPEKADKGNESNARQMAGKREMDMTDAEKKAQEEKAAKEKAQKAADEIANSPSPASAGAGKCIICGKDACKDHVPPASATGADAAAGKTGETAGTSGATQPSPAPSTQVTGAAGSQAVTTAATQRVQKEDDPMKAVLDAIAALGAKVETVQKSVDERVAGLESQVKESVKKAAELEAPLKGTVVAAPPGEDLAKKERTRKSNGDEMGEGYWDSAMHGRRK